MRKFAKISLLLLADIIIVLLSITLAFALRYDSFLIFFNQNNYRMPIYLIFMASAIISNAFLNCYDNLWKFAGFHEAINQGLAAILNAVINLTVFCLLDYSGVLFRLNISMPITIILIIVIIEFIFMITVRFIYRISRIVMETFYEPSINNGRTNIVIFGDVESGTIVIGKNNRNNNLKKKVIAIIENKDYQGLKSHVSGVSVYGGGIDFLSYYLSTFKIDEVVLTKRSVSNEEMIHVYDLCKKNKANLKVFTGIEEYRLENLKTKEVKIEDLLGRIPKTLDLDQIRDFIRDKVILVTGGAGSIGSELCRQCLQYECRQLIIYDFNENGLFEIDNELKEQYNKRRYRIILGSVRDKNRLDEIFNMYNPQVVFHAAAHKHVPMMEINPREAIKNNVFGTLNVASKAIEYKVQKFILISTDKAVNPTNIMGATKRMAEMIIQTLNKTTDETDFAAVRFGNVLGSNGSVIPTFKKQIEKGGPVTVTHMDVKRYFMTIPEAVQLVMRAGSMAEGGEIFILEMGEPVRIYDLAQDMIRLSGFEPNKDIMIEITGLRPGEKMYEELSLSNEDVTKTSNNKIYICRPNEVENNFLSKLERLKYLTDDSNEFDYVNEIKNIVKEYNIKYDKKPNIQMLQEAFR